MSSIIKRLKDEPAFLGGVLVALVGLGTAFGLALNGEQVGAVTGLIGLLTGVAVRGSVYNEAGVKAEVARQVQAQDPTPPEKAESVPYTYPDAEGEALDVDLDREEDGPWDV